MSYFVRLNFFFWIILFSVQSEYSASQPSYDSEITPSLKRVRINGDSVIFISDSSNSRVEQIRKDITLNYRNHNIVFELQPADSIFYQFFLEGFDKEWTSWKHISYKEYTNIPAGRYRFKIRYIISDSTGGEITLVSLRILPLWYFSRLAVIIYLLVISLIIWTLYDLLNLRFARKLYMLEQIINKRTEDLIIEKEKTEALLANVLPKNTASEIMEKGKATKIKYNFVTVLFSDIQGFTKIAEEMNPEILIDELDKFFFYFDSVVEKYGIEKIKTIGDAYMCAGGIP